MSTIKCMKGVCRDGCMFPQDCPNDRQSSLAVAPGSPERLSELNAACFATWRRYQQAVAKFEAECTQQALNDQGAAKYAWGQACEAWCRAREASQENSDSATR